ncbi:MAG: M20/M25/M40 family metallo-hydrolase, partial [Thermoanaerobaculia bacterium]|nr:M20/M25/M40 family metallo-hydrolase [Thermoanaerobaculia bacterium]
FIHSTEYLRGLLPPELAVGRTQVSIRLARHDRLVSMPSHWIRFVILALAVLWTLPAATSPAPEVASDLSEEGRHLRGYLSLDTSNPPGREHVGVAYLAEILRAEGIEYQILASAEGRTSLLARLQANPADSGVVQEAEANALVLLHHVDVVAPGPDWTHDPFGGDLSQGLLLGRGAIDDKSLGIAHLAAFLSAARSPRPRQRDLIFLAVADEERGGLNGTQFVLENFPELFRGTEAVLNEGGSTLRINGRTLWFGIEVAQKRPLWLRLRSHGRGGHAATQRPNSGMHSLLRGLGRLVDLPSEWRVAPEVREYLAGLAPLQNSKMRKVFDNIDDHVGPDGPKGLIPGMESLFTDTFQVTRVIGSEQINIIPATATAEVDVRLLPDSDDQQVLARVREVLGAEIEVEVLVSSPYSSSSPTDSPFFELLRAQLETEAPVVPFFSSGFTDSRFFRQRGISAYGLNPFTLEPQELRGIHAADEAIPVEVFERGVERIQSIVDAWIYAEGI